MPIDPSIPLGAKAPDQMQNLSSLMTAANGAQSVQNNNITLGERQGLQQFMSNPGNYTDQDGNVDFNRAMQGVMKVAPTTGLPVVQNLLTAQKQHVDATSALSKLDDDNRSRVANTLTSIPPDADPKLVYQSLDALGKAYNGKLDPWIQLAKQGYDGAAKNGPAAVDSYLTRAARSVLPQETQQAMNTPAGVTVSDGQTSQVVSTKPGTVVPMGSALPGTSITQKVGPSGLENIETDAQGNKHVVTRTTGGAIVGTRPLDSAGAGQPGAPAGPFRLPPNETQGTYDTLQKERDAARAAANTAPVLHDINRTIVAEASKGLNTGALGALTQKLSSATGYQIAPGTSTDYNLLGKMLERSALTAAQGMGPHTNAGLEASVRANGSLEYTPQAIKKIAYLNDAIVHGAELYRNGLEKAVSSDVNGIFAKRQFDQQWSKVATPQVLRLKNAVDNGSKDEVDAITQEVGGRGSSGAKALHDKLTQLLKLAGQ